MTQKYKSFTNWDTEEAYNLLLDYPPSYDAAKEIIKSEGYTDNALSIVIKNTVTVLNLSPGHLHIDNVNFEEVIEALK